MVIYLINLIFNKNNILFIYVGSDEYEYGKALFYPYFR